MRKFKAIVVFLLLITLSFCGIASAHEDQKEHDADLKYALFGDRNHSLQSEKKAVFQAIADAASICIDQFSPNATAQWKQTEYGKLDSRIGLGISFEDIDLNATKSSDGKNITAHTHRMYTHMGWDYSKYPNAEFWNRRKQILITTVKKELFISDTALSWFPWLSEQVYGLKGGNEQIDAFCAVVYYVHILGDHIAGDTPEKLTDLDRLARYENLASPGIIPELQEYLEVLFPEQENGHTFGLLQQELDKLCYKVEKNCAWHAIDTPEKCAANQEYANQLLEILGDNLPILLGKESFFTDVFH